MSAIKNIIFKYTPESILRILKKWHYVKKLKAVKEESEEDLMVLKRFIKEGDSVFDIGANFGAFTKIMSKYAGKSGKVLSFEPIPETYNYLNNNIIKLALKNVVLYNVALSDSSGVVTMEVPKYEGAGDNFYEAKITTSSTGKFKKFDVKTTTLDELFKHTGIVPSFIKCDVEGHEWFVFKGASELLSKHKPVLLVEINQNLNSPDTNTSLLLNFLKSKNYSIYVLAEDKLVKWTGERKVNYYFLTNEHVSKLNA